MKLHGRPIERLPKPEVGIVATTKRRRSIWQNTGVVIRDARPRRMGKADKKDCLKERDFKALRQKGSKAAKR